MGLGLGSVRRVRGKMGGGGVGKAGGGCGEALAASP